MKRPYIQKRSWPDFRYQGRRYSMSHLDEYRFSMRDQKDKVREVVVTFSDHCFTRKHAAGDERALIYPGSSREQGCFSFDRYAQSLHIRAYIEQALTGRIWNAGGGDYSIIPTVTRGGEKLLYNIIFRLDPVTGLPVDLHMAIRTAYLCEQAPPRTFGEVRFRHLVTLRMQKKHPKEIWDGSRRIPRLA